MQRNPYKETLFCYTIRFHSMKVEWDENKCIHSAECVKNLPSVFMVKDGKFVIEPTGAPADDIRRVVDMCPSGALKASD